MLDLISQIEKEAVLMPDKPLIGANASTFSHIDNAGYSSKFENDDEEDAENLAMIKA